MSAGFSPIRSGDTPESKREQSPSADATAEAAAPSKLEGLKLRVSEAAASAKNDPPKKKGGRRFRKIIKPLGIIDGSFLHVPDPTTSRPVSRFANTPPVPEESDDEDPTPKSPPRFTPSPHLTSSTIGRASVFSPKAASAASNDSAMELVDEDLVALKNYQETLEKELTTVGMQAGRKVDPKSHAKSFEELEAELLKTREQISRLEAELSSRTIDALALEIQGTLSIQTPKEHWPGLLWDQELCSYNKYKDKATRLEGMSVVKNAISNMIGASSLVGANHKFLSEFGNRIPSGAKKGIRGGVSVCMQSALRGQHRENVAQLGTGSFGAVFCEEFGPASLAKKSTLEKGANLQSAKHALQEEAAIALFIDSHFVLKPVMISKDEDVYFPLAEGGTLLDRITKNSLNRVELIQMLYAIASGLFDMHAKKVVHRDIKPDNIFILDGYDCSTTKVSDLGLSAFEHNLDTHSMDGTLGYMAPEVMISGEKPTTAIDIYSFGVLIFYTLIKTLPLPGNPPAGDVIQWATVISAKPGAVQQCFNNFLDVESIEKKLQGALSMQEMLESQAAITGGQAELNAMIAENTEQVAELTAEVEARKSRVRRVQSLDPNGSLQQLMVKAYSINPKDRPTAAEIQEALLSIATAERFQGKLPKK